MGYGLGPLRICGPETEEEQMKLRELDKYFEKP